MTVLALLSIFKNEAHIMQEWLTHYVEEGVTYFFLIDNGSTDDYMHILGAHIASGLVTLVKDTKRHAQVCLYNKYYARLAKQRADWLLTCDFDEFVYVGKPFLTIVDYLNTLPPHVRQIRIPWKMFGSSGHVKQPDSAIKGFKLRERLKFPKNRQCKSISRTSEIGQLNTHETYFTSEWSWHHWACKMQNKCPLLSSLGLLMRLFIKIWYVRGSDLMTDGSIPRYSSCYPEQDIIEDMIQLSSLQCNHYYIQSREWYRDIKMTRGDVTIKAADHGYRTWDFFEKHDFKDIADTALISKNPSRRVDSINYAS